jgi:uncharacterized protein (DUF427 family)
VTKEQEMTDRGRVRVERSYKRVRVMFNGIVVADTSSPWLVWEKPYYPTYYFPAGSVRSDLLEETGDRRRSPSLGEYAMATLVVGHRRAEGAVSRLDDTPIGDLAGAFRFDWQAMDHWFEEDEEVFVHARDPYRRVDALRSSRHVRVEIDGVTVAESRSPVVLFETGLPVRFYLDKTDVRMDMLAPTDTVTACPYKGVARYWTATVDGTVYPDIVWGYDIPLIESLPIAGRVAFYNEKVDVFVDGERQERPTTVFS